MRRGSTEKRVLIACGVIAIGVWYMVNMKGCDCIKAEQIFPILATGIAIGVLITTIKAWLTKRKEENEL